MKGVRDMRKYLISISALVFLTLLCTPAFAGLTITNEEAAGSWGNKRAMIFNVAFDSSYASGGESLDYLARHMKNVDQVIVHGAGDYQFKYDKANKKLKVFTKAPAIVYDEKITTTSSSGATLMYPAAWIQNVTGSSGYAYRWAWSGTAERGGVTTLGSGQFALNAGIVKGERTGVTTGPDTGTFYVTYITQAWNDVYELLEQNLPVVISGAAGASTTMTGAGNTIFAYGYAKTGSTLFTPIDYNDHQAIQNDELGISLGEHPYLSGQTTTYLRHGQYGTETTAWVTMLKWPEKGSWLYDHAETAVSPPTCGVSTMYMASAGPLLFNRISSFFLAPFRGAQMIIGNRVGGASGVSQVKWSFENPELDIYGHPKFNAANALSGTTNVMYGTYFGDPTALSAVTPLMSYVWGRPSQIPNLIQLEVPDGTDLSSLTDVKVIMIGR
jgi:hypothetical protein